MPKRIWVIQPSAGGAVIREHVPKVIRLLRMGCVARPFFHISVMEVSGTRTRTRTGNESFATQANVVPAQNKPNAVMVVKSPNPMPVKKNEPKMDRKDPIIEQIGNYDPLPNYNNEKLVAINFERLDYWIREGALISNAVRKLLGLSGYFPVHPNSLRDAWQNRLKITNRLNDLRAKAAALQTSNAKSDQDTSNAPESTPT